MRRILIVEDCRAMRLIIRRALRQADIRAEVIEASDGASAVSLAVRERPDLAILDWNLPDFSGIELVEALKEAGCCPEFGFVTAETDHRVRTRAVRAGARFIINKPFKPQSLREAVDPRKGDDGVLSDDARSGTMWRLPRPEETSRMLHDLLGCRVSAQMVKQQRAPVAFTLVAIFDYPDGSLACVVAIESALAAGLGAALARIPESAIAERVVGGRLPDTLFENLSEVLNVWCGMANRTSPRHLRFAKLVHGQDGLDPYVSECFAHPRVRRHFRINLERYAGGVFSIFVPHPRVSARRSTEMRAESAVDSSAYEVTSELDAIGRDQQPPQGPKLPTDFVDELTAAIEI